MGISKKINTVRKILAVPTRFNIGALKRAIEFYNKSSACQDEASVRLVCRELRILTHTIEKGLSLPVVKNGFGKAKIKEILRYLDCYIDIADFSYDHEAFTEAVMIIKEYIKRAEQYDLEISYIDLSKYENYTANMTNGEVCGVVSLTNIPKGDALNFAEIAHARHSIRKFSEKPLPEELMRRVVRLAETAPSACNRQSIKVLHVKDKALSREILDIQGGAKGHSTTELLLLVSDLGLYKYLSEIELPYLDGGIYLMNLLHSLTYYGIGSCPLVWDDYSEKGKQLRELIYIPTGYHVLAIVQCGFYPEDGCSYAVSKRRKLESCYKIVDFKENSRS